MPLYVFSYLAIQATSVLINSVFVCLFYCVATNDEQHPVSYTGKTRLSDFSWTVLARRPTSNLKQQRFSLTVCDWQEMIHVLKKAVSSVCQRAPPKRAVLARVTEAKYSKTTFASVSKLLKLTRICVLQIKQLYHYHHRCLVVIIVMTFLVLDLDYFPPSPEDSKNCSELSMFCVTCILIQKLYLKRQRKFFDRFIYYLLQSNSFHSLAPLPLDQQKQTAREISPFILQAYWCICAI